MSSNAPSDATSLHLPAAIHGVPIRKEVKPFEDFIQSMRFEVFQSHYRKHFNRKVYSVSNEVHFYSAFREVILKGGFENVPDEVWGLPRMFTKQQYADNQLHTLEQVFRKMFDSGKTPQEIPLISHGTSPKIPNPLTRNYQDKHANKLRKTGDSQEDLHKTHAAVKIQAASPKPSASEMSPHFRVDEIVWIEVFLPQILTSNPTLFWPCKVTRTCCEVASNLWSTPIFVSSDPSLTVTTCSYTSDVGKRRPTYFLNMFNLNTTIHVSEIYVMPYHNIFKPVVPDLSAFKPNSVLKLYYTGISHLKVLENIGKDSIRYSGNLVNIESVQNGCYIIRIGDYIKLKQGILLLVSAILKPQEGNSSVYFNGLEIVKGKGGFIQTGKGFRVSASTVLNRVIPGFD